MSEISSELQAAPRIKASYIGIFGARWMGADVAAAEEVDRAVREEARG
jgi:hypothetical protein